MPLTVMKKLHFEMPYAASTYLVCVLYWIYIAYQGQKLTYPFKGEYFPPAIDFNGHFLTLFGHFL